MAAAAALLAALLPGAASAQTYTEGTAGSGILYFTTYRNHGTCKSNCPTNVWSAVWNYNGDGSLTVQVPTPVAGLPGADGIVISPGGSHLLIGGQLSGKVFRVNPTTGSYTSAPSGNAQSYHVALSPTGQGLWTSGSGQADVPAAPTLVPLNPLAPGTPVGALTGADKGITQVAFVPGLTVPGLTEPAFYTASNDNGVGDFGLIDLATHKTYQILSNVEGMHGIIYDPFTQDVITSGGAKLLQFDPSTLAFDSATGKWTIDEVGQFTLPSTLLSGSHFDQLSVDGKGHLFVAYNGGSMLFVDYSTHKSLNEPSYFVPVYLEPTLDDIVDELPEAPLAVVLPMAMLLAGAWVWRRRRINRDAPAL